ncbi:DUF1294 domain-containing protein [Shewanella eurypsychrophilus]|uniref:DUF1294 domain-containing protein n=1 Tax=Shewanella eurypsychrophilus TaxID=2593656 RepID=A0ABX6V3G8_9GAMM|nr:MULTISPECIES: DUF1294 domain-containing protein [Shewanella]QFU21612.1 DUF1294 domain-containing protein [Shewanella sp. YLB-09]QPG56902.1 DUF1294 domain-containing protein [Shewanella eurypsychrophilus]
MNSRIKIGGTLLFLVLVTAGVISERLPLFVIVTYLSISIITYIAYARDKSAARNGQWRIKESTLHLLSLCCGWPGAVIAQQYLRHKSQKLSFRVGLWCMIVLNTAGLGWSISPQGQAYLPIF